jgi:hypothetical protein
MEAVAPQDFAGIAGRSRRARWDLTSDATQVWASGSWPSTGSTDAAARSKTAAWPSGQIKPMRRAALATAMVAVAFLLVAAMSSAIGAGRVCRFVHASIPYSAHGRAHSWRVYVAGATSCRTAEDTLNAVMHLRAAVHEGRDEAHSYFTYRGWICPFGRMGYQACNQPSRRPYRAQALAVECAENGCPSRRPPTYFP